MGILEMDFERILGVTFFISSFHSIMLWAECLKKIGHMLSQKNICKLQNVKSPWWGISDQINFFMSMINNRYHQYYHTWSIYTHMQISLPCLHLKKHICTRNIKRCNPKLSATYFFDIGSGVFTLICKYHYRIHI